jgi:hypothetical protein
VKTLLILGRRFFFPEPREPNADGGGWGDGDADRFISADVLFKFPFEPHPFKIPFFWGGAGDPTVGVEGGPSRTITDGGT